MRPLPADSDAYFGSTADGNTALPTATGAAMGFGAGAGLASVAFGAAGAGAAAGAAAGVAVASAEHSALRNSFHFMPLSVPPLLAAWYFALHSCVVRACAGNVANVAKPDTATAHNNFA